MLSLYMYFLSELLIVALQNMYEMGQKWNLFRYFIELVLWVEFGLFDLCCVKLGLVGLVELYKAGLKWVGLNKIGLN